MVAWGVLVPSVRGEGGCTYPPATARLVAQEEALEEVLEEQLDVARPFGRSCASKPFYKAIFETHTTVVEAYLSISLGDASSYICMESTQQVQFPCGKVVASLREQFDAYDSRNHTTQ